MFHFLDKNIDAQFSKIPYICDFLFDQEIIVIL